MCVCVCVCFLSLGRVFVEWRVGAVGVVVS